MALGCTLTQFDHFVLAMMVMMTSFVQDVTSHKPSPLGQATCTPGPNSSADFSRTGARGDKSPFKQVDRKGDDSGECRTFTSDLLSGLVGYPKSGMNINYEPIAVPSTYVRRGVVRRMIECTNGRGHSNTGFTRSSLG